MRRCYENKARLRAVNIAAVDDKTTATVSDGVSKTENAIFDDRHEEHWAWFGRRDVRLKSDFSALFPLSLQLTLISGGSPEEHCITGASQPSLPDTTDTLHCPLGGNVTCSVQFDAVMSAMKHVVRTSPQLYGPLSNETADLQRIKAIEIAANSS